MKKTIQSKRFLLSSIFTIATVGLIISTPVMSCTTYTSCIKASSQTAAGKGTYCDTTTLKWTACPTGQYNNGGPSAGSTCCVKK